MKVGDRVKALNGGIEGRCVATSGRDQTCLIRFDTGNTSGWIQMSNFAVIETAPEPLSPYEAVSE